MNSSVTLTALIDQSLLLTDVKKRLLKKQLPFWSEDQKMVLKNYLESEPDTLAKALSEAAAENLTATDLDLLGKSLSKARHKLLNCEESMETENNEPKLENLLKSL